MKLNRPNDLTIHDLREVLRKKSNKVTCWQCAAHLSTDVHHLDGSHRNNVPANLAPWCKRCHNEHHGISDNLTVLSLYARQYDALQRQRIAMGNRVAAYERLGYEVAALEELVKQFKDLEKGFLRTIDKALRLEPIHAAYLDRVKGVGPAISAALLSEIGDPGRFDTISALWAYCGLDVRDGVAPKRRKGTKANWNHKMRMVLVGRMVPSFIKLKSNGDCFGRALYDRYKAFYVARDGDDLTPLHVENRARRKVAKVFLSCLWVAWRRVKGLPVTEPYAMDRLGHSHLVTPEDWAGEGWDDGVQLAMDVKELEPHSS